MGTKTDIKIGGCEVWMAGTGMFYITIEGLQHEAETTKALRSKVARLQKVAKRPPLDIDVVMFSSRSPHTDPKRFKIVG